MSATQIEIGIGIDPDYDSDLDYILLRKMIVPGNEISCRNLTI